MSKTPAAPLDGGGETIDGSCPRYWPAVGLPESPFLPGVSPRAARPAGNPPEDLGDFAAAPLTTANWRRHGRYLFGIDLFNRSFWWEAHEQWEVPWRCGNALQRPFLQGLIQIAASLLKRRLGNSRGHDLLSVKGRRNLDAVRRQVSAGVYMGLRLPDLERKLDRQGQLHRLPPAGLTGPMIVLCHDA